LRLRSLSLFQRTRNGSLSKQNRELQTTINEIIINLLQRNSKVNTFNNLYLNVNPKSGKLGSSPGSSSNAAKFFTTPYQRTLSIHAKDDTDKLTLVRNGGLLEVVDMVEPWKKLQSGQGEWDTFLIGQDGQLTVNDGANIPSRKWVAFDDTDGSHYIGLWDGKFCKE
jgi:hypothetical protein